MKINERDEGNMDDSLPETIDCGGKRKVEEEDVLKSQEQFPKRSCPSTVILNPLHSLF